MCFTKVWENWWIILPENKDLDLTWKQVTKKEIQFFLDWVLWIIAWFKQEEIKRVWLSSPFAPDPNENIVYK
jgi:hypothetical protein